MTRKEQVVKEWEYQKEKWNLREWELRFSKARRNLGSCDCARKRIYVSLEYMKENPFPVLKDTLLHEIAHALQFRKSGYTDHGDQWKELALQVGCSPRRCAPAGEVEVPKGKYAGICPSCDNITYFYRKVKRRYYCRLCSKKYEPEAELRIITTESPEFKNLL